MPGPIDEMTDYTLRVLMFCALNPERSVTIAELDKVTLADITRPISRSTS